MREFKRKKSVRQPLRLIRGSDGRLRTAGSSDDIGDVWAEQRRIRLQEAIEEDKRKAAKAAARKERWQKLFKRQGRAAPVQEAAAPGDKDDKVVEIKISLPSKLSLPKLPKPRLPKVRRRYYLIPLAVLALAALSYGGVRFFAGRASEVATKQPSAHDTLGASDKQPRYDTLLPAGKTIEQLGGWARVSPPGKEPVFAYIDTVEGVQLSVSQQPLPQAFDGDGRAAAAQIAKEFGANESIGVDSTTVYVGTSAKGPQSVIFVKDKLLILIKSTSRLTNDQWAAYVAALD